MDAFRSGVFTLIYLGAIGAVAVADDHSPVGPSPMGPNDVAALLTADEPTVAPQALPEWDTTSRATEATSANALAGGLLHADRPEDTDDIATLLEQEQARAVPATESLATDRQAKPRPSRPYLLTIEQLERAATGRPTDHGLSRLILQAEQTARSIPASNDSRRSRIAELLAWAFNARGELRAERGDAAAALADFDAAIRRHPECAEALHNRAVSLAEAGRQSEALHAFDRAIAARPHWVSALRNRATLRASLGEVALALADCDAAIAVAPPLGAPNDSETRGVLEVRAAIYRQLSRPLDALADYTDALDHVPANTAKAGLLVQRASVLVELARYDQATEDCFAALESDARNAEAYRGLAWLLSAHPEADQRDTQLARESATRARQLLGKTVETLEAEAVALAATGEVREAQRKQREAIRLAEARGSAAEQHLRLAAYEAGQPWLLPSATASKEVVRALHTEE